MLLLKECGIAFEAAGLVGTTSSLLYIISNLSWYECARTLAEQRTSRGKLGGCRSDARPVTTETLPALIPAAATWQALASLLGVLPKVEKLHTIIYLDTEPSDTPTDAQRKTAKDAGQELRIRFCFPVLGWKDTRCLVQQLMGSKSLPSSCNPCVES